MKPKPIEFISPKSTYSPEVVKAVTDRPMNQQFAYQPIQKCEKAQTLSHSYRHHLG